MARRIYATARRRVGNLELALMAAGALTVAGLWSSVVSHF